jgi:N6-L-threonylcarbamoyladenine synthase
MIVLGIESSCDDTGVAIYSAKHGLLAHQVHAQNDIHAAYGGVVPELASRDHIRVALPLIHKLIDSAGLTPKAIQGVAYTKGPGLAGSLLVGSLLARSLAYAWECPAIGVHHLEGHLLAPMLETPSPTFPFLGLLVSGGHTLIIAVKAFGKYEILGETLDDAVGEAFDKTAKLLGLGYPGGAKLAKLAKLFPAALPKDLLGHPHFNLKFPRPMTEASSHSGLNFSFSGLKTHVALEIKKQTEALGHLPEANKIAIAHAFEEAAIDTLVIKITRALAQTGYTQLVVSGGVGANLKLREKLKLLGEQKNMTAYFPRFEFCTDNGAMIAYVGCQRLLRGEQEGLDLTIQPRWPLDTL